jgi:hypothetical protein
VISAPILKKSGVFSSNLLNNLVIKYLFFSKELEDLSDEYLFQLIIPYGLSSIGR